MAGERTASIPEEREDFAQVPEAYFFVSRTSRGGEPGGGEVYSCHDIEKGKKCFKFPYFDMYSAQSVSTGMPLAAGQ